MKKKNPNNVLSLDFFDLNPGKHCHFLVLYISTFTVSISSTRRFGYRFWYIYSRYEQFYHHQNNPHLKIKYSFKTFLQSTVNKLSCKFWKTKYLHIYKGKLHPKPKLSMFWALSQNYQRFLKICFIHPEANCPRN